MTMQRVHLDISSDIFDKVIFFLENLPKNKVIVNIEHNPQQEELTPQKQKSVFEDFLSQTQEVESIQKFDRDTLHER